MRYLSTAHRSAPRQARLCQYRITWVQGDAGPGQYIGAARVGRHTNATSVPDMICKYQTLQGMSGAEIQDNKPQYQYSLQQKCVVLVIDFATELTLLFPRHTYAKNF
eukprot:2986131-Rhodomonas_salina.4